MELSKNLKNFIYIYDIDKNLRTSLFNSIIDYNNYCNELDTCLTIITDKNGNIFSHYFSIEGKRLVELSIIERQKWLNYAFANTGRGYTIRTFTYYWLHKLCIRAKDLFIDESWQNSLKLYFNEKQ